MIRFLKSRVAIYSVMFLLLGSCFTPLSSPQKNESTSEPSRMTNEGQILFGLLKGTSTYLMQKNETITHTWPSNYQPGLMARYLGDGKIARAIRVGSGPGGGGGGGIQIIQWDGTVIWDFRYNTNGSLTHHDIRPLPNGNILMIAWETKTMNEAIAAGRNPDFVTSQGIMPDHIIEVKPTGSTTGDIVWEWHVWDHLIQDYDPKKENYGIVSAHPELVDINYIEAPVVDWMHTNSIDYNEEFDQILLSVCFFNEIWVIDHSTTKQEAAGHTGGNSGKGGDLLYRWGNPQVYDMGTSSDQKLFMQHDATWIDEGYPGEGNILLFNNGQHRPGFEYSTIDEFTPPVDENGQYYLHPGSAYGPEEQTWVYTANPPTSFYSSILSGASRLPDGNTLICVGVLGKLFEVTPNGTTVWEYNTGNLIFKVEYVIPEEQEEPPENDSIPDLDCSGSLSWSNIEPGATVSGSFQVQNIGGQNSTLNWTIDTESIDWGNWTFTPSTGENLTPEDGKVTIQVSVVVPNQGDTVFRGNIRVENQENSSDFELIPVYLKTPVSISTPQMVIIHLFLKCFTHLSERTALFFQRILFSWTDKYPALG